MGSLIGILVFVALVCGGRDRWEAPEEKKITWL
jgi:hypothetical protein